MTDLAECSTPTKVLFLVHVFYLTTIEALNRMLFTTNIATLIILFIPKNPISKTSQNFVSCQNYIRKMIQGL